MPPKERGGLEELSTPLSGSECNRETGRKDSGRDTGLAAIAVSQQDGIQEDEKLLVITPVPTSQACLYWTQQLPLPLWAWPSLLLLSETLGVCLAGARAGIGWRGLAAQSSVPVACCHATCLFRSLAST